MATALIALGTLWVVLIGGCTFVAVIFLALLAHTDGTELGGADLVELLKWVASGAVVAAPGAGFAWAGWALRNADRDGG